MKKKVPIVKFNRKLNVLKPLQSNQHRTFVPLSRVKLPVYSAKPLAPAKQVRLSVKSINTSVNDIKVPLENFAGKKVRIAEPVNLPEADLEMLKKIEIPLSSDREKMQGIIKEPPNIFEIWKEIGGPKALITDFDMG